MSTGGHHAAATADLRITPLEALCVLGCTALGVGLRLWNLSGKPLWTDEFTTLITARRPLWESLFNNQDPQPPLYQLLLRPLLNGGPPSIEFLRAPALVVMLLLSVNVGRLRHELGTHAGMGQVVDFLHQRTTPGQVLHVLDWKFCDEFIHPEVLALEYHGLRDRPIHLLAQPPTWDPARLATYRLPDEGMWIAGFGGTVNSTREHLSRIGRGFEQFAFGDVVLYRVQPARAYAAEGPAASTQDPRSAAP